MPSKKTTPTIVRNLPFVKFKYRGSHSKPVRRELLITERGRNYYVGYQLRDGNDTYDMDEAPIRRFTRSEIVDGSLEELPLVEAPVDVPETLRV